MTLTKKDAKVVANLSTRVTQHVEMGHGTAEEYAKKYAIAWSHALPQDNPRRAILASAILEATDLPIEARKAAATIYHPDTVAHMTPKQQQGSKKPAAKQ